jgi:hypothetical protein
MQPLRPSECGGPFRQLLRWIWGRVPQRVHDPRSALSLPKIPRRTQTAGAGDRGYTTPDPPCPCRKFLAALRRPGPGTKGYTTPDPPCPCRKFLAALRRPGPGTEGTRPPIRLVLAENSSPHSDGRGRLPCLGTLSENCGWHLGGNGFGKSTQRHSALAGRDGAGVGIGSEHQKNLRAAQWSILPSFPASAGPIPNKRYAGGAGSTRSPLWKRTP